MPGQTLAPAVRAHGTGACARPKPQLARESPRSLSRAVDERGLRASMQTARTARTAMNAAAAPRLQSRPLLAINPRKRTAITAKQLAANFTACSVPSPRSWVTVASTGCVRKPS